MSAESRTRKEKTQRSPNREKLIDLLVSFSIGVLALLLFHLDHLIASYSGWDDPYWWLHLLVDSTYVVIYGGLFFVALRGWRIWRNRR
jgi:cation transport ATPase